jgi:hypothetical protein
LKKSIHGLFQCRNPKIKFPYCSQTQELTNQSLILVGRPWPSGLFFNSLLKQSSRFLGVIGNDQVSAGPFDAGQ